MYTITIKHADGFTSHINVFFGELIDAIRYCEGLKELNSKFGVHDEVYRIHDIRPGGIYLVREYKCGQWGPFVNEEDEE